MKKTSKIVFFSAVAVLALASRTYSATAQNYLFPGNEKTVAEKQDSLQAPEGYMYADSTVIRFADAIDSSLVGKNIFEIMPSKQSGSSADVNIHQSMAIRTGMMKHILSNRLRTIDGYRVRIFFDNKQSSRVASENMVKDFRTLYPEIPAYRNHVYPYFKVTVGDFRTRSEAMQLLRKISEKFPTAFVVKESINYPVVDKLHPVETDTVRILRPINGYGDIQTINL